MYIKYVPSPNLSPDQQRALETFKAFCKDKEARVFILTGYAGTGKTTLLRYLIKWLADEGYDNAVPLPKVMRNSGVKRFVPMASTGRAVKVLSDKIGQEASTVHSWIYNFTGFNQDIAKIAQDIEVKQNVDETGQLYLNFGFEPLEESNQTNIYFVDEASMISDTTTLNYTQAVFGSGRLLNDLLCYDPQGKFVFVGDNCQLPPVNGSTSPALDAGYITSHYHMPVTRATLNKIIRQQSDNDIIVAAERMRKLCTNPPSMKWGKFPMRGYTHIKVLGSQLELVDQYVGEVKRNGYNATTLLTGTNKACTTLSRILRQQLGFAEPTLMVGELLLVTQNNMPTRLMNGDLVKVKSIGSRRTTAQLSFVQVEVEEIATKQIYNTLLIEDLLYSNATNLNQNQQKRLFIDFYHREKRNGIKPKDAQFNIDLRNDPFLNALRAVYGYAITCHKAQGGEWPKVYLDIPRSLSYMPSASDYQWLYTAMTRASNMLYIANDFFIV